MEINPLKKGYILKSRYIIDEVIGRGGSAFVYHAKKIIGDYTEDVLIKELCPKNMYDDLTRTDDGSITVANDKIFNVFLHNMKSEQHTHFALRKNGNPFVFDIHDIFSDNNTEYIVTAYERGKMLRSIIDENISVYDISRYMTGVLDAVEALHCSGILHLDLTPDNIFISDITAGGINAVKLIDFNNCININESIDYDKLLVNGAYAPLELCVTAEKHCQCGYTLSYATDLYFVCGLFLEMISGLLPFELFFDDEVFETIKAYKIPDMAVKKCMGIIERGLKNNPSKRFQSVSELRTEFKELMSLSNPNAHILSIYTPSENKSFIGRQNEISRLDEKLKKDRIVCICADSFAGKTEFVNEYCRRFENDFDVIHRTEYYENIRYTIASTEWSNINDEINRTIDELYVLKKALFTETEMETLLIIEDVLNDDDLYNVTDELLRNDKLHIIITTHDESLYSDSIRLSKISVDDLRELLPDTLPVNNFLEITNNSIAAAITLKNQDISDDYLREINTELLILKEHNCLDDISTQQIILSYSKLTGLSEQEVISFIYASYASAFGLEKVFNCNTVEKGIAEICMFSDKAEAVHLNMAIGKLIADTEALIKENAYINKIFLHKIMRLITHISDTCNMNGNIKFDKNTMLLKINIFILLFSDYLTEIKNLLRRSRNSRNTEQIVSLYEMIIYMNAQSFYYGKHSMLNSDELYQLVNGYCSFCSKCFGDRHPQTMHSKNVFNYYISRHGSLYNILSLNEAKKSVKS